MPVIYQEFRGVGWHMRHRNLRLSSGYARFVVFYIINTEYLSLRLSVSRFTVRSRKKREEKLEELVGISLT